jgi:hypothetical protein
LVAIMFLRTTFFSSAMITPPFLATKLHKGTQRSLVKFLLLCRALSCCGYFLFSFFAQNVCKNQG